jgi:2-hydroxychromene-2-carboxylate isomerase
MNLEAFFDCSSPWAYIGFERVQLLARELNLKVIFRPVLVGGIFNAVNKSVYDLRENIPSKLAWFAKDLADWSNETGVEINFPPPIFPVNSAKVMRACLLLKDENKMIEFARAAFTAYWRDGRDISRDDVIAEICNSAGIEQQFIFPRLDSPELKSLLRANTQEAIDRGAFGVPTFFLNRTNMFFGSDRLPIIEAIVRRGQVAMS